MKDYNGNILKIGDWVEMRFILRDEKEPKPFGRIVDFQHIMNEGNVTVKTHSYWKFGCVRQYALNLDKLSNEQVMLRILEIA